MDIIIVLIFRQISYSSNKTVRFNTLFSRAINNTKVEFGKKLRSSYLAKVKLFKEYKVLQVLII